MERNVTVKIEGASPPAVSLIAKLISAALSSQLPSSINVLLSAPEASDHAWQTSLDTEVKSVSVVGVPTFASMIEPAPPADAVPVEVDPHAEIPPGIILNETTYTEPLDITEEIAINIVGGSLENQVRLGRLIERVIELTYNGIPHVQLNAPFVTTKIPALIRLITIDLSERLSDQSQHSRVRSIEPIHDEKFLTEVNAAVEQRRIELMREREALIRSEIETLEKAYETNPPASVKYATFIAFCNVLKPFTPDQRIALLDAAAKLAPIV